MQQLRATSPFSRAPRLTLVVLGLATGVLLSVCGGSLLRKLSLMDGTTLYRFRCLASVSSDVGLTHFRPCGGKVEELHLLLSTDSGGVHSTDRAVRLIASIIIDGPNCNQHILKYIDSDVPLPDLPFYSGFRLVAAGNHELARSLNDEQGLMLWMLTRINPETLLPLPEFGSPQAESEQEFRQLLSEEWKYLFTSVPASKE